MVRLSYTPLAREVIQRLAERHGRLCLVIGDTGCCGFSNVLLSAKEPGGAYEYVGERENVGIYLQRAFRGVLGDEAEVDAVPVESDDSFSLETEMGYRLILRRRCASGRGPGAGS